MWWAIYQPWASKNWCPASGHGFPTVSPRKPWCSLPEAQTSLRPRGSMGFHGEKLCWPPCNYGCLAKCCNWWGWNCGDGPKQEDFATYLIFPSQNTTLRFSPPHSVFWTGEHQTSGWFSASFPRVELTNTRGHHLYNARWAFLYKKWKHHVASLDAQDI